MAHDDEAFAGLIALLGEVFAKDLSPQRVEMYFRALADYSIEDIAASVDEAIRRLRFSRSPRS